MTYPIPGWRARPAEPANKSKFSNTQFGSLTVVIPKPSLSLPVVPHRMLTGPSHCQDGFIVSPSSQGHHLLTMLPDVKANLTHFALCLQDQHALVYFTSCSIFASRLSLHSPTSRTAPPCDPVREPPLSRSLESGPVGTREHGHVSPTISSTLSSSDWRHTLKFSQYQLPALSWAQHFNSVPCCLIVWLEPLHVQLFLVTFSAQEQVLRTLFHSVIKAAWYLLQEADSTYLKRGKFSIGSSDL